MIGQKPVITYGSFTILKPIEDNFSYIFFNTEDIIDGIGSFFSETLWKNANVPKNDADKCAEIIKGIFKYFVDYQIE